MAQQTARPRSKKQFIKTLKRLREGLRMRGLIQKIKRKDEMTAKQRNDFLLQAVALLAFEVERLKKEIKLQDDD